MGTRGDMERKDYAIDEYINQSIEKLGARNALERHARMLAYAEEQLNKWKATGSLGVSAADALDDWMECIRAVTYTITRKVAQ